MNRIKFLGVGAGDFGMLMQVVPTHSIYCELDGLNFMIDPGPGTLINARLNDINILNLNGVLLSHLHQDHSGDVGVAVTSIGSNTPSFLIAEEHCLKESKEYFPCVSRWHQRIPQKLVPVEPGEYTEIGKLKIKAIKCNHYDPCVGFLIKGSKTIGYTSDGAYYPGQEDEYKNCDLLIVNVMDPHGKKQIDYHMSVDDSIKLIKKCKPKLAIITHYSYQMLHKNPIEQAKIIEKETGVKTEAALPGMEINLDSLKSNVNNGE